jgi:peptidoglycan/xylan/chitin deacetylase (PgdA/CDA1 family)
MRSLLTSAVRAILRAARRRRSVILCYHGVAPSSVASDPDFMRVPPDRFRSQVEALREAGFSFVTVRELARRAQGGTPPAGMAALSFDDGWDDNHAVVLPILRELKLTATVYVATGLIGQPNPWLPLSAGARMMTVQELRDLHEAGFELGAHTVTHPDLSRLDRPSCLREMVDSRETLERETGAAVDTFAYPFCHYGPAAIDAAKEAGFLCAVTCQGRGGWAPLEMKRALITGKDGWATFLLKIADAYQPLFESRAGCLVRASTRRLRRVARSALETRRRG